GGATDVHDVPDATESVTRRVAGLLVTAEPIERMPIEGDLAGAVTAGDEVQRAGQAGAGCRHAAHDRGWPQAGARARAGARSRAGGVLVKAVERVAAGVDGDGAERTSAGSHCHRRTLLWRAGRSMRAAGACASDDDAGSGDEGKDGPSGGLRAVCETGVHDCLQ